MDYYSAFPFYTGYQGYGQWAQPGMVPEDRILEDLEYLQQMYPTYAKKYQGVISGVVDKMDYDGSFIYDQYPDKLTIQRMVASVMTIIKTNEESVMNNNAVPVNMPVNGIMPMNNMPANGSASMGMPVGGIMTENMIQNVQSPDAAGSKVTDRTLTEDAPWNEKEPWIRELVTVLMYYEILARRRRKNKQWFNNTMGNRYYQI